MGSIACTGASPETGPVEGHCVHAIICCWVILQLFILAHLIHACSIRSCLHRQLPNNGLPRGM